MKRSPRNLPDDKFIEEIFLTIKNPQWRWLYGMLATYGLRGHEVFFLDIKPLQEGDFFIRVQQGKTGYRIVYPFKPDWINLFDLVNPKIPEINLDRENGAIGNYISQMFRRANIPFHAYDLRHAWAVRTIEYDLDISLAAQQMGHSLKMHSEIYHSWISDKVHARAFSKILSKKS